MQSGNPHGSKQDIGTPILFGNRNADEVIGVPRTVSPNSSRQLPLDSVSKFSGSVGALLRTPPLRFKETDELILLDSVSCNNPESATFK
jgi:hypothetical protein